MRVCVLGGTRFIGRALVEHLVAAGHQLLVVHRGKSEPDDLAAAEHLHVDRTALSDERSRLDAFAPEALVDTYAMTAQHVEAAIAAFPQGLPTVVLSSMDVYRAYGSLLAGRHTDPVPLTERSPLRAERYPYRGQEVPQADFDTDSYEKLDVEERYLARGASILRLGFVYGEHDLQRREEFILRRVRAGRPRIPFGVGSWLGSRTYVADIGLAVEQALTRPQAAGEVFNVCEEASPTLRLWAEDILRAAGVQAELVSVDDSALPADLALTGAGQPMLGSPQKAKTMLDWVETDPGEATARSVRWHLANPPAAGDADFDADDHALGQRPSHP